MPETSNGDTGVKQPHIMQHKAMDTTSRSARRFTCQKAGPSTTRRNDCGNLPQPKNPMHAMAPHGHTPAGSSASRTLTMSGTQTTRGYPESTYPGRSAGQGAKFRRPPGAAKPASPSLRLLQDTQNLFARPKTQATPTRQRKSSGQHAASCIHSDIRQHKFRSNA